MWNLRCVRIRLPKFFDPVVQITPYTTFHSSVRNSVNLEEIFHKKYTHLFPLIFHTDSESATQKNSTIIFTHLQTFFLQFLEEWYFFRAFQQNNLIHRIVKNWFLLTLQIPIGACSMLLDGKNWTISCLTDKASTYCKIFFAIFCAAYCPSVLF